MRHSLLILFLLVSGITIAQKNKTDNEWPAYGRDGGGSRYSPLTDVKPGNVKTLKPAWTYRSGELKTYEGTRMREKAAFETTPVMVDGTLYFSTPTCRVIALDAATGAEKWVYNPGINLKADYSEVTSRGVSVWPASDKIKATKRIFIATIDGRLIALDAKSGTLITSFGNGGSIDLREGLGRDISVTSPPAIIDNMVIIGSSLGDNQRYDYPRGTVRAYDAVTGEKKWSWDPIPVDSTDKAWSTWNGERAHKTGAANAWSILSVDAARDIVYVPTSSPSPDYYGGDRKGQNLYGNSIVALRASTGKLLWYFQVVHHDLWDYDIAAQPMLINVKKDGKTIPAVAVGTKMGHIFILHRETGKSLFPIEERAVPVSDIQGEEAYATQPFPVLPAPLGIHKITDADAWGLTEKDREEAARRIGLYTNKGTFTPPSFKGTLITPGNVGGVHWGGMCFDQKQGLLITNINMLPAIIRMLPRENLAQLEKEEKDMLRAETGRQTGTPYVMKRDYLFKVDMRGLMPQSKPPWGTILSIDTKNGEKKWERPLGYMLDPKKYPGAEKWGSINFGGAICTATGLTFVAATLDNHFRAFNTTSGELLWEYELPASAQATPMTYKANGKQYVVIAAGGHGKLATKMGDYVIAFAVE